MASPMEKLTRVEDSSSLEGREACKNPMLIDVILSNMFEFLDFEDLSPSRCVSKQWHKVSLPAWLSKGPALKLALNPNRKQEEFLMERVVHVYSNMNHFLRLVHNEFHSYGPYEFVGLRQYKRFDLFGDATDPVQHHYLQQFYRIYGQLVTELKVNLKIPDSETGQAVLLSTMSPNLVKLGVFVRFAAEDVFAGDGAAAAADQVILTGEEHHHSKLKSLQVNSYDFRDDPYLSRMSVAGWSQLLRRYPNLETLLVGVKHPVDVEAFDRMLEAIGSIRRQLDQKSVLLGLRHLEICLDRTERLTRSILPRLRDAKLTLETLGLRLIGGDTLAQAIAELLGSQSATLKTLRLHDHRVYPLLDFQPPELPFLQSLELHGNPVPSLEPLIRSFQNLQSLLLILPNTFGNPFQSDLFGEMVRGSRNSGEKNLPMISPTLAKLHVHYGSGVQLAYDPRLASETVRKLARFFPNLEDLQMWLNNETLLVVVQSWPRLRHLSIIGNDVSDGGISGIIPHLCRMQDLKSFSMKHDANYYLNKLGPTGITAKSLLQFLALPINLERLEVTFHAEVQLDDELLRRVEEKIKTVRLTRAIELEESEESSDSDDDENENEYSDGDSRSSDDGR